MAQQKTQIEYINVDDLKAYERNARTHSDEQIKQVAESIKEFGFTNPVLIDEHNELIAGHGRTLAAKSICMKEGERQKFCVHGIIGARQSGASNEHEYQTQFS